MSSDIIVWDECSLNKSVSGFFLLSGLETLKHCRKIKLMLSFGENRNVTQFKNMVKNIVVVEYSMYTLTIYSQQVQLPSVPVSSLVLTRCVYLTILRYLCLH